MVSNPSLVVHAPRRLCTSCLPQAKPPGRTYRYYSGAPLWAFGDGLSLTEFAVSCQTSEAGIKSVAQSHAWPGPKHGGERAAHLADTQLNCTVTNRGSLGGDEVLMLMHRFSGAAPASWASPLPRRSLVDFQRVSVPAGGTAQVAFAVPQAAMALTSVHGEGSIILYSAHLATHLSILWRRCCLSACRVLLLLLASLFSSFF